MYEAAVNYRINVTLIQSLPFSFFNSKKPIQCGFVAIYVATYMVQGKPATKTAANQPTTKLQFFNSNRIRNKSKE